MWYDGYLLFASKETKDEFDLYASDSIRQVVFGFVWAHESLGIHSKPVINSIARTRAENAAADGVPNSLHLLRESGEGTCCFAVDFKNIHYTVEEKVKLDQFLHTTLLRPTYEVITRVHGTGPHFHVGDRRAIDLPIVG